MVRKPLDSIEYELTYLELRPESERLSDTMDPPVVALRRRDERVDDAVAVYGIAAVDTDIRVVEAHATPPLPADLHRVGGPAQAHAVQRVGLISRRPPSPRRLRSWTLLQLSVVAVSTSLGPIAAFDARAAHALFVASRAS